MKSGWRLHGILAGLVVLQLVVWFARHRSSEEWIEVWRSGALDSRLRAAHVLANRGPTAGRPLGSDLGVRLLRDEKNDRIRSLAFSSDVCKLASPRPQLETVVEALERDDPAAFVDFVLQCRKVGGASVGASSAMKRAELAWYERARRVDAWTEEEREQVARHLEPWLRTLRAYLEETER